MSQAITPCIWFQDSAKNAADFYTNVFGNSQILQASEHTIRVSLQGFNFTLLNGSRLSKISEAISFYVYCGQDDEVERLYNALKKEGSVLMPLQAYPWCRKYAWVKDKYGVSWQLDVDPINNAQKIVPSVMFVNQQAALIKDAVNFYHDIFRNCILLLEDFYPPQLGMPPKTVRFTAHKLDNYVLNFMSSHEHQEWGLDESVSFVLSCRGQEEIDYYWKSLSDGGREQKFAWLKDRFGISWQVLPENLDSYMQHPSNIEKLMQMSKIQLSELEL